MIIDASMISNSSCGVVSVDDGSMCVLPAPDPSGAPTKRQKARPARQARGAEDGQLRAECELSDAS